MLLFFVLIQRDADSAAAAWMARVIEGHHPLWIEDIQQLIWRCALVRM